MAEMGTEPDPDSESKIWRLAGSGSESLSLEPDPVSESIFSESADHWSAPEMGMEQDPERSGSGVQLHFSDLDLSF